MQQCNNVDTARLFARLHSINTHRVYRVVVAGLFLLCALTLSIRLQACDLLLVMCMGVLGVFTLRLCLVLQMHADARPGPLTHLLIGLTLPHPLPEWCVSEFVDTQSHRTTSVESIDVAWLRALSRRIPLMAL